MITLAFDTCLDKMYVALKVDGKILASKIVENHDNKYHSAFLISELQQVMSENSINPKDLDLIATNIGPGSFTGIRACVTVARVMAQALDCKVAGISSLEILSRAYNKENTIVALDARKNAAYLYMDGEVKGAIDLNEIQSIIKKGNYNVLTDDKLQNILGGVSYQTLDLKLGEILADLAEENFQHIATHFEKLKPLYIQPPPCM